MDNQVTIIEIIADYMCLVTISDKLTIDNLIDDLNDNNVVDQTSNIQNELIKYISIKIDEPIANKCYDLMNQYNDDLDKNKLITVISDDGVESAQCYTYAEGYNNQLYMLMTLTSNKNKDQYTLGFPKFDLNDDEEPETLVEEWFKKKIKKIPLGLKKNMKMITVVGSNANILVLASKIINKKK